MSNTESILSMQDVADDSKWRRYITEKNPLNSGSRYKISEF